MTRKSAAAPGLTGGQTLVELIVALGIAGTLASLAVPAFERVVLDGRRTAVVNDVVTALLLARTEAIKRRQPVVACGVRDGNGNAILEEGERVCAGHDWTHGWIVGAWRDADGDHAVDAAELTVLREHLTDAGSGLVVTAGAFTATPPVAPAGTTVLKPFAQRSGNGTVTVCDRRGPAHARAIVIAGSGRTRVTSRTSAGGPLRCP
jgi:type IV fimbrial biogenesis protein FimT